MGFGAIGTIIGYCYVIGIIIGCCCAIGTTIGYGCWYWYSYIPVGCPV